MMFIEWFRVYCGQNDCGGARRRHLLCVNVLRWWPERFFFWDQRKSFNAWIRVKIFVRSARGFYPFVCFIATHKHRHTDTKWLIMESSRTSLWKFDPYCFFFLLFIAKHNQRTKLSKFSKAQTQSVQVMGSLMNFQLSNYLIHSRSIMEVN